jgi:hypothetical protein
LKEVNENGLWLSLQMWGINGDAERRDSARLSGLVTDDERMMDQ